MSKNPALSTAVLLLLLLGIGCKKDKEVPVNRPGTGVTDIEGRHYQTVVLGNGQEWMAENIRTSRYSNGDTIPNLFEEWATLRSGAWAYYDNDSTYEKLYGKLYNWYAVSDARNICPQGWRVPADDDWKLLFSYLGMSQADLAVNGKGADANVGGKMKNTSIWEQPNTGATNESGFSGLPGGFRDQIGSSFSGIGSSGYWWGASDIGPEGTTYLYSLYFRKGDISTLNYWKNTGASCRCIKD